MSKKPFEKTSITDTTFSDNISIIQGNNRATRKLIQGCAIVAFTQFTEHGSCSKLDQIYKACKLIGSHGQFESFVTYHSNIKLENKGKVNAKFMKSNKSVAEVGDLTDWWYKFEKPVVDKSELPKRKPENMADSLVKALTKGITEHTLTNDVTAQKLINYLNEFEGFNECDHVAPEVKVAQG